MVFRLVPAFSVTSHTCRNRPSSTCLELYLPHLLLLWHGRSNALMAYYPTGVIPLEDHPAYAQVPVSAHPRPHSPHHPPCRFRLRHPQTIVRFRWGHSRRVMTPCTTLRLPLQVAPWFICSSNGRRVACFLIVSSTHNHLICWSITRRLASSHDPCLARHSLHQSSGSWSGMRMRSERGRQRWRRAWAHRRRRGVQGWEG